MYIGYDVKKGVKYAKLCTSRREGGRVVSTFSAVFHGGKDKAYGSLLGDYTNNVIQDLVNQAESKGFNALLGLRFSHTYVQTNDALIIVAYATPCSVR